MQQVGTWFIQQKYSLCFWFMYEVQTAFVSFTVTTFYILVTDYIVDE